MIPWITNQEMSCSVHRKAARIVKFPVLIPLLSKFIKKFALFIKHFYTMSSFVWYNKIVVVLDKSTVSGIDERLFFADSTQKSTIEWKVRCSMSITKIIICFDSCLVRLISRMIFWFPKFLRLISRMIFWFPKFLRLISGMVFWFPQFVL